MQLGSIAELIAAIAALVGVLVAYDQLKNLAEAVNVSSIAALLQLESDFNQRKQECVKLAIEIQRAEKCEPANRAEIELLRDTLRTCKESWYNTADRLAFCFLHGFFKGDMWIEEYHGYFEMLLTNHADDFGPKSPYTNVKRLNKRWKLDMGRLSKICPECGNEHA